MGAWFVHKNRNCSIEIAKFREREKKKAKKFIGLSQPSNYPAPALPKL
jgi:hypothetical protein